MESDEEFTLTINENFAQKYEEKKKAEELSILRDKYGDVEGIDEERLQKIAERKKRYGIKDDGEFTFTGGDDDDDDDDTSEEEDEYGELVTPAVDAQIMKTITLIRNRDPKVYDAKQDLFSAEEVEKAKKEWEEKQKQLKAAGKPVTLKDYHRKVLLEDGGVVNESEEKPLTHVQEQQILKKEMKDAVKNAFGDDDDEDDDSFFTQRAKTKEEIDAEEEDYKRFLLESMAAGSNDGKAFQEWQNYKENPQVNPDEAFLMEYILSRGWIDKKNTRVPTYQEIVEEDEDEEAVEAADRFESSYNHRFEEEGSTDIVTHARNIENSVRRKDNRRKEKRLAVQERKKEEKLKKMEELKRLKNLKKQEIFEKLKKIQEITGNNNVGFDDVDLDGEFDPNKHDEKMGTLFNDTYYDAEDNKKPVFDDDIDISDIVTEEPVEEPKKGKKNKKGKEPANVEEDDFIMDADYLPGGEHFEEAKPKKGKDKKSNKRSMDEYLDDYYQLDYEDMVGDLPTRFKYHQVKPSSFGLDPVEILMADEKDLNDFVSLKKLAPYRPADKQEADIKKYSKKKRIREFRKKIQHQG
ncbi:Krr1-domain-containing protein [Basidiobolus meristosporus CBS 931.73]|uniref:Krr1-domain-containing protein n=1 Tax=Basidiobolus meristosporus CBS 931.73 TaxID=1314790 RepID=A0A1Y1ZCG4_9FUNG|nr:Krr1-domain-containing protein [Basidiobolus meristosporus CBS 931.73]|eukprot:ORY07854.1 Krr1-domain-containing protein [Basidiobolus meristosporus CBS 931.73]